MSLESMLIVGAILFCIGLYGSLARRNALAVLMSIELMLNGTRSPQSNMSPSGRMRVGKPSPSKTSFHISAIIKFGACLNSTHISVFSGQPNPPVAPLC